MKTTETRDGRAAHTPGPWEVHRGRDGTLRVYRRTTVIAQFGEGIDDTREEHRNAEANARLIASAPELLAALKQWESHFTLTADRDGKCGGILGQLLKSARAAITRSEGGAP